MTPYRGEGEQAWQKNHEIFESVDNVPSVVSSLQFQAYKKLPVLSACTCVEQVARSIRFAPTNVAGSNVCGLKSYYQIRPDQTGLA
jgi:hypothetical protein